MMTRLPRPLVTVLIVFVCLLMAAIQFWRAETKHRTHHDRQVALQGPPIELTRRHTTPSELAIPRIVAEGTWLSSQSFLLDNRTLDGRVGYHVVTPLQLRDGAIVLINRGWIAAPPRRTEVPVIPPPSLNNSVVRVEGWAVEFDTGGLLLGDGRPQGLVWPYLRAATYRDVTGSDPLGLIVLQIDSGQEAPIATNDRLRRPWTTPQSHDPAFKHLGYAIMWIFFACLALFHSRFQTRHPKNDAVC